ncbi:HAD-IIB family hydrolase [Cyanobium gracile]|uniref:HAD-IIB family hydrolase n=1 Tax=Cyanobium gracile UHCC 0281 TaxID=3110309 RepID=A0ABU5ST31_9CYAN|nr:HAD-IIB family hydrolase [Cyanobium gracile]MEA5441515.1 HAD-IIB family hydrolase [Cyanobium gracile UHCC 0281]
MQNLLICTDLDRTLLPNGEQAESTGARSMFARFVSRPEVFLAYVSGRHLALVEQSIQEYGLPLPEWIIGDVGSSIYAKDRDGWSLLTSWSRHISLDWKGFEARDLVALFSGLGRLVLQPEDKQNTYKLSYFLPLDIDLPALKQAMVSCLEEMNIAASLIFSVDEQAAIGLLDVLPKRANKLHAIEFLMREQGFLSEQTLFAGDSGNDLTVLTSSVPSVLVANAHQDVVEQAFEEACRMGTGDRLYLAKGGFLEMNGNYSAGILEGIAHFHADAIRELD